MPKASEIAAELRRIADAFAKEPDTEITRGMLWFHCDEKEHFLAVARLMPRPFSKRVWTPGTIPNINLTHKSDVVAVEAVIDQHKLCRIIKAAQPAEYECEPVLSQDEDAELEAASVDEE